MKWKHPPIIKIYEALGVVADERIEMSGDTAKISSSSGNKFYDVTYDQENNAIMANDNSSYWQGSLGYPAIAYLLKIGVLEYKQELGSLLKDIAWKDINQKFKNNFDKSLNYILSNLDIGKRSRLEKYAGELGSKIKELNLGIFGKKVLPPSGY